MKRFAAGTVFGLFCIALLAGCGSKYEEVVMTEVTTIAEEDNASTKPASTEPELVIENETDPEETEYQPEERVEVDGKIQSYLTGEMVDIDKANRRPVAVMMSNDKESRPQYGINRAGVVYEAPVEGNMNRFMAILEDYDDLDRIGSTRSCRTYYTFFAREFDALYSHYGQSTFAKPYLKNVDNINGIDGVGGVAFYRTKDKKAPHNAYTSGDRLKKAISKLGYRQEYNSSYGGHYQFAGSGREITLDDGIDAYKVVPGYAYHKPWFEYNEKDGLYYRYQYDGPHKGDEGQIAVKNIIFQYCEYGYYATTDYLNINVHTSERAYYVTNGKAIPCTWKKDGEFGVTRYYKEDGEEIVLNKGKTWVCIIPTDRFANGDFYGKE